MSAQEPIKQNRVGFKRNSEGKFEPYLEESIPATIDSEKLMEEIQEEWYHTADGPSGTAVVVCALLLKDGGRVEGVLHTTKAAMDKSFDTVWQAAHAKAVDRLVELHGFPHAAELYAEMKTLHQEKQATGTPSHAIYHDGVYQGTKVTHDILMTLDDYTTKYGVEVPENYPHKGDELGYLVELVDGGTGCFGEQERPSWHAKSSFDNRFAFKKNTLPPIIASLVPKAKETDASSLGSNN